MGVSEKQKRNPSNFGGKNKGHVAKSGWETVRDVVESKIECAGAFL